VRTGRGGEADLLAQPELPASLGPGAAGHGDPLRRVVLGMAARAEDGKKLAVGGIWVRWATLRS
jgi:hypothetical protein